MKLFYYIINGRGVDGLKFQLAKIKDEQGNTYKGEYDMARHFSSQGELKEYLANIVKCSPNDLTIEPMKI
jgi:hypothetical protein